MQNREFSIVLLFFCISIGFSTVCPQAVTAQQKGAKSETENSEFKNASKVRALMVTGGCCHDYQNQKRIISDGLSKSVGNIEWTILDYGSKRDVKADIYKTREWIKDFDIVIHNECFGGVTDAEFVKGIVAGHTENKIPAIVVHCSMHSYRNASSADAWRGLLGVTSRRHEKKKHPLDVARTETGKSHPILSSLKGDWKTANGELYIIEKVWPTADVLATVYSEETKKDEPVIWANEIDGTRVFGISLGHHNETMQDPQWQTIVTDGWKWAIAK